ncbi:MAG TPA: hypothetical protein VLR26_05535 [Frankiaceae bacterium]|nr:hypothetical protein [Frankiaceae bacterium]
MPMSLLPTGDFPQPVALGSPGAGVSSAGSSGGLSGGRLRRLSAALMLGALTMSGIAACAPSTPKPATPVFAASAGIEAQIDDEPTFCDPADSYDKPGPQALRILLNATYGPIASGITRSCDGTVSDHHEGRALDWMADYANPDTRAKALAVIDWLRATDQGNANAVARRLGLQYFIYNKQMYGSWNNFNPTPYACGTDPTACHVNHIHFSFTWAGAYKQTSFWRGSVLPTVPSAGSSFIVDARSAAPALAPAQLGSGRTYTVEVSGTYRYGLAAGQVGDAACSQSGSTWAATRPAAPFGSSALKLKIGGGYGVGGTSWTPVVNTGGGCNTRDHWYRMTVRSWSALTITGLILDGRADNSGSLTVKILPAG